MNIDQPTAQRIIQRLRGLGTLWSAQIIETEFAAEREPLEDERAQWCANVRALADFYEDNPDLATPALGTLMLYVGTEEGAVHRMHDFRRRIGGLWKKGGDNAFYTLAGKLCGFACQIYAWRSDVCERVVVGTHTEVTEVPDPELVKDIPLVRVEKVVEKVEWICPEVLV